MQGLLRQLDVHAGPQVWTAIDRELEALGRLFEALDAAETSGMGGQGGPDGHLD